jgi:Cu/Ag efflux pump CusA
VAVKVYGDDFAAMSQTADQVAKATLRKVTARPM